MIPHKIQMFMGYNNLALILEQERKHWLLKTDKRKQLQDKVTGDLFQGQIDNLGSDIIIESEKLPVKNDIIQSIKYLDSNVHKILNIDYAAFTYSSQVDGFMIARIVSTSFPYSLGTNIIYKQYKLRLKDCKEIYIPFGSSINTSDVFVDKWLCTTTPPSLLMVGDDGVYSIERSIDFDSSITNPVFYYPLTKTLQPLNITNVSAGVYETDTAISDDGYIGYPLYWFTCDQSSVLSKITFTNNIDENNHDILYVSNEGNASMYNSKIYFGINGAPSSTVTDLQQYSIEVHSKSGLTFNGNTNDFNVDLDPKIKIVNTSPTVSQSFEVGIECNIDMSITMSSKLNWTMVDNTTYRLDDLSIFNNNNPEVNTLPIIEFININLDETVKPHNTTTDLGYAGIRMSSSNIGSDIYDRYPYSLNEWDGLPEWLNETPNKDTVPQHMAIYAIHNTPEYIPDIPDSRQVAAILLDPGKIKTDDSNELSNDEKGRAYILSNDDIEYENNAKSSYPKPSRTIARICDIPTSVVQLSGISGIAPTSIVDDKYVRTQASYSESDKDKLYNKFCDNWVKPTMLDYTGKPITTYEGQDDDYVFKSYDMLNAVDLKLYNDLRYYENINPIVKTNNVEFAAINVRGTGYKAGEIGVVVVGGFAFNYQVSSVDKQGGVTNLVLFPDRTTDINLSNFNLEGDSGVTEPYGTSPLTGNGKGLKFKMVIRDYDKIKTKKGEIRNELYAFVRSIDGLWMYTFNIDKDSVNVPKNGKWDKVSLISEFEETDIKINNGVSTKDAQINSIIPSIRTLPVVTSDIHKHETYLSTYATSSFINIIDNEHVPFLITEPSTQIESDLIEVDMCCWYCDGIKNGIVQRGNKNINGVIDQIEILNDLRFDSYIFYKFEDANDINNLNFTYGVIHRGFNNYLSTDKTTLLPPNKLSIKSFVHANEGTTVVWDTPNIGPMMWAYNPTCHLHEHYIVDPNTKDLVVDRTKVTWKDIVINVPDESEPISLVGENDKLLYNIITNNSIQINTSIGENDPIYKQPEFTQLSDLQIGCSFNSISELHQPVGNWQLIHPRVESYTLENLVTDRKFTPIKMQLIKGASLGNPTNVTDDRGNIVNTKCILINETSSNAKAMVYNTETGKWDSI